MQTSWLFLCTLLAAHHVASELSSDRQAGVSVWDPGREGKQTSKPQQCPRGLLRISGFSL